MVPTWADKISLGADWAFYKVHGRTRIFIQSNGIVIHCYLIDQLSIVYEKIGRKAFITLAFFPAGSLTAYIGDAEVMKEILNDRVRFPKPVHHMALLNIFGLVCLSQTRSKTLYGLSVGL
jgi:hypothetical protein